MGVLSKRLCGGFLSNFLSTFHIRSFSTLENVSLEQVTWYILGPESYVNKLLTLQENAAYWLQRPAVTEKFWRERDLFLQVQSSKMQYRPKHKHACQSFLCHILGYLWIMTIINNLCIDYLRKIHNTSILQEWFVHCQSLPVWCVFEINVSKFAS